MDETEMEYGLDHAIAGKELKNYENLASFSLPLRDYVPSLNGFDICSKILPLHSLGGDMIAFIDFHRQYNLEKRIMMAANPDVQKQLQKNTRRLGILHADVEGHQRTDTVMNALLYRMFRLGVRYELEHNGHVTADLFENLNMEFFESTSINKTISALYGELYDSGKFRYLSAGVPYPVVFSKEQNRFVSLANSSGRSLENTSPLGMKPSSNHYEADKYKGNPLGFKEPYFVNEFSLQGAGDIMVLYSDGLGDHRMPDGTPYFPGLLELKLTGMNRASAKEISDSITADLLHPDSKRKDDISYIIIKKN